MDSPIVQCWIIQKIECKKVKDEIKEGYQIIFFLNCRWVGFKSPKLVQWKPNAMLIWNILSVHWMFECVGGLQYLRSLKWEQKKKRASVARIVTKYVWPPQPNLKCQSLENLQCTFFFGLFVLIIFSVFRMFLSCFNFPPLVLHLFVGSHQELFVFLSFHFNLSSCLSCLGVSCNSCEDISSDNPRWQVFHLSQEEKMLGAAEDPIPASS